MPCAAADARPAVGFAYNYFYLGFAGPHVPKLLLTFSKVDFLWNIGGALTNDQTYHPTRVYNNANGQNNNPVLASPNARTVDGF
jgi:hypothetical protein